MSVSNEPVKTMYSSSATERFYRNLAKIVMDKQMLQVSGRGGGEVLDLNPKTVDAFYPSPRKAARASRLQNSLRKLSWNILANS